MLRRDTLYLVVTVLKTKNTYEIKMRKPTLGANQFAYKLNFNTETDQWFDRILDTKPLTTNPPEVAGMPVIEDLDFGKTTSEKVMDRLR